VIDVSVLTKRQLLVRTAIELALVIAWKSKTHRTKVTLPRNPVSAPTKKSIMFSWKTELTKTSVDTTPMKTNPLRQRHELLTTAMHSITLGRILASKSSKFPNLFTEKAEKDRSRRLDCATSAEPMVNASFWVQFSPTIDDGPENSTVFERPAPEQTDESQTVMGARLTRQNEFDIGVEDWRPIVSFIENHRQHLT
jgi:hypothetical protein